MIKKPSFLAILFVFSISAASAANYFEQTSELYFDLPEEAMVQELQNEDGRRKFEVRGKDDRVLFHVEVSEERFSSVLEWMQLREVDASDVINRELLGMTAVELVGMNFERSEPRRALIVGLEDQTLSILSSQVGLEFDQFLRGIHRFAGFADTLTHPLKDDITSAVEQKIFSGYLEGDVALFRPNQGINRAEFLKVLVLSVPELTNEMVLKAYVVLRDDFSYVGLFPDVDREAWFAPYIFYAVDKGWVKGYPDGTFRPGEVINIAESAKMLLNSRDQDVLPDADVWFRPYLDILVNKQVILRDGDRYRFSVNESSFFAHDPCTRAQAAASLHRFGE